MIAERLVRSLKDGVEASDTSARLQEKTEEIIGVFDSRIRGNISGQLIVAVPGISQLWEISFIVGQASVSAASNHLLNGDRGKPGVFFAERYSAETSDKSVEELKLLAALTVLDGGLLNPTGVGGLDLLVSKHGEKPYFLEDGELQQLCDRAESLHNILTAEIFRQH